MNPPKVDYVPGMKGQALESYLRYAFSQRIHILDGAMGTMIQKHQFTEADFRGERFKDHKKELKGDNDLLCFTQPEAIQSIHSVSVTTRLHGANERVIFRRAFDIALMIDRVCNSTLTTS